MAQEKGSTTVVSFARETTYGTLATGNALQIPIISVDGGLTQSFSESEVLQGDRNPTEPALDEKTVRLTYTIQPDVRSIGFILAEAFGLPTTTGVGPYTHVFKIGSTLPTGVSFEHYFPNLTGGASQLQYVGCKFDGFSFDATPGGVLRMTLNVYGQDEQNSSRIDAAPYKYAMVPLRQKDLVMTEGSTTTKIQAFSLSFTNTLEEIRTIGNGGKVLNCLEGWARPTGSITRVLDALTAHTAAKNETEQSHKIKFPSATDIANHYVEFEMQETRLSVASPMIPGPGGLSLTQEFRAFKDNGAGASSIIVTVVNDVSSYTSISA